MSFLHNFSSACLEGCSWSSFFLRPIPISSICLEKYYFFMTPSDGHLFWKAFSDFLRRPGSQLPYTLPYIPSWVFIVWMSVSLTSQSFWDLIIQPEPVKVLVENDAQCSISVAWMKNWMDSCLKEIVVDNWKVGMCGRVVMGHWL